MADLNGQTIADTYSSLLKFSDNGVIETDAVQVISDGRGTATSLSLSTLRASIVLGSTAGDDFIVDGTTLVVEGDNNRVGIGTASPDSLLHIEGALNENDYSLHIQRDGTSSSFMIKLENEDASGTTAPTFELNHMDNGDFHIGKAYNDAYFTIQDTGNVGIGTTSPTQILDLCSAQNADCFLEFSEDNGSGTTLPKWFIGNEYNADSFVISNGTEANAELTILTGGNVGIGTAAPSYNLEISNATGGSLGLHRFDADNNIGDGDDLGVIYFGGDDDSSDGTFNIGAKILSEAVGTWVGGGNDCGGDLSFWTNPDGTGTGLTERMVIQGAGNVGIGTASPDTKLEVVGSFAANGPSSTFVTFADGDNTPSVATGNIFKHHASADTITMFDGGVCGQIITVISTHNQTYDVTGTNLKGGTADIATATGDVTMWVFDGTYWYLLSWMDVTDNLADGSAGGF